MILTTFLAVSGSTAAFTLDAEKTVNDEICANGSVNTSDNDGLVGMWTAESVEGETIEKELQEFDEIDSNPGEDKKVNLGVIYSEDGSVEFGDEAKYFDGETGEEINSTNLNIF